MTKIEQDYFIDGFGNKVEPGDEVVYILGELSSKRLIKGVVEKIVYNPELCAGRYRYYIRPTQDSDGIYSRHKDNSLSPIEIKERIMKIG